jgi:uncharacterized repeat protein (TIGR01451 family)
MIGRIACFAVVVLVGVGFASSASAQDEDVPIRRSPSLSERLQRFRQDLLGEPRNVSQPPRRSSSDDQFGAGRKIAGQQPRAGGITVAPERPNPVSIDAEPRVASIPIPGGPTSAVTVPSRLQPQAARRAQPSGGPSPATIEPVEPSNQELQDNSAPDRHGVDRPPIRSRLRASDDDVELERPQPRLARSQPLTIVPRDPDPAPAEISRPKPSNKVMPFGVLFTSHSPILNVEATGPRKILIGKEAQFIIKIRNTGAAANNVTVTINVPNYAEVTSLQVSSGTAPAPTPGSMERREALEWKIPRLEAKGAETLTLKIVPRKSTPLDLSVQWTYTPEASQTLVEVQEPKLVMTLAGPDEVMYGQSKLYKLTVSNPGNGDTENVMVALLPVGRASEGVANHRIGTLHAGESKAIDIELTARQAGAITIKAQAFADGGLRSETAEHVLVRRANLRIEVQAPKIKYAGTVGTYRVIIVNAGNATADNVQVAAMLPPDAKYVSSNGGGRLESQQNKVNWTLGTLQAGGERILEMQCSLSAPGDNRMQFVTMADDDLSAAASSETRVEALADLKLEVRDPQGPIAVGEYTVYEVHIRNRGTKAAEGVDLTVFFSDGLEATSVDGGPHEIGPGQVVFKPIAMLPAGETTIYHVHTRADKPGNHIFRAEVICSSLQTKLAAEETTHFYGDDKLNATETARQGKSGEPSSEITR